MTRTNLNDVEVDMTARGDERRSLARKRETDKHKGPLALEPEPKVARYPRLAELMALLEPLPQSKRLKLPMLLAAVVATTADRPSSPIHRMVMAMQLSQLLLLLLSVLLTSRP